MTGFGVLIGYAGTRLGTGDIGLIGGILGGASIIGLTGTTAIIFITITEVAVSIMHKVPVLPAARCQKV